MRQSKHYTVDMVFDEQTSSATSNTFFARDFRNASFSIGTGAGTGGTVRVKGGLGDVAPDFDAAISETNRWTYLDLAPNNSGGSIIDGDTGISASPDSVYFFEVNFNTADWIALDLSSVTGGSFTADLTLTDNG